MKTPPDVLEIFLQPGEFYFGEKKTRIRTLLGSCVAITLWHPRLEVGGMCHYMLPRRPRRKACDSGLLDGRYAEDAMKMFLREIEAVGARAADFHAKLFGGARMVTSDGIARRLTIAEANVEYGREAIAQCGFTLCAEDLGGRGHRNVILDIWSGDVWVRRSQR